ncbi:hypothetical protein IMSHALPRED_007848 [Imshaugia aleurites]|uniref:Cell wall mannoprotein PIR1-like C-terminal domain-containing protein n=1 Tax=Imshaugia aleurites TaxID=172621 RepID=A0A8H3FXE2_9LECA|nr:hypothetical protein IMSHALPRED_007848 [Imshaugia aleurites]
MKSFTAATLLAVLASTISAQDTNGCDENYSGTFEIAPYNITANIPAQGPTVCTTNPIVSLKNSVLTDQDGRTGEVVANHQFQFDNPVQGPTTSGFSVCSNGSLAINGNALFYGCNSGSFSNLYDISIGAQCYPIYIVTYPCTGGTSGISSVPVETSSTTSSSSTTTPSSTPVAPVTSTTTPSSTPVAPVTSTSTTSTPVAIPATSTSTTSTPVAAPATSTTSTTSVPFPAGNSTTLSATASTASTSPSSTSATTSSTTTAATTFKGAASMVAAGGKVVAVIAGIAAFALF